MKRIIDTLNEMSFHLPDDWSVSEDKYNIMNGQGFINKENYVSKSGKVISLFEIHRNPDEFFESYQQLVESYDEDRDAMVFEREFSVKANDFSFPVYILKGIKQPTFYLAQVFVNCGDCLACFMLTLDQYSTNNRELLSNNQAFSTLANILRTIE